MHEDFSLLHDIKLTNRKRRDGRVSSMESPTGSCGIHPMGCEIEPKLPLGRPCHVTRRDLSKADTMKRKALILTLVAIGLALAATSVACNFWASNWLGSKASNCTAGLAPWTAPA